MVAGFQPQMQLPQEQWSLQQECAPSGSQAWGDSSICVTEDSPSVSGTVKAVCGLASAGPIHYGKAVDIQS